jgi:DNA-binding SARP family transcriptional activator
MAAELEFCLLGPVAVHRGGVALPVSRGRQRAVLALLLLNAGRVVSVDEMAEALWGCAPPPSAEATVRNYVKRLRRVLGDDGQSRIVTRPPGYLIQAGPEELDVARFEALLAAARTAARRGSWPAAADQAQAALAQWRGEPLADVKSEVLSLREVPRLAELRLQAAELRLGAELQLGRHAMVIAELERMAATHPLREHGYALLMLALYRDGRRAEALAVYRRARRVLVAELGAEPGAELRELHRQVLVADPALAEIGSFGPRPVDGTGSAGATRDSTVPRELPGPVRHFTGRAAELAFLSGLLGQAGEHAPSAIVISAIAGMAGLGKTALAVHWAHQVADRFPDGQLYVNLRGYDPDLPVPPADALAALLRALGVAGHDIPAGTAERAARYRSLLSGRRMLVLLDNAATAEQVRPLLPGSPSCMTLVTSRDALAGLVARDGAHRLDLDLLTPDEATELLRTLIGERVRADPAATEALAGQCARLPLALRVAAELAAARPGVPLAVIVRELADQQRRLDVLDAGGDPRTAMRAVFSWSLRHLDRDATRGFWLIGLHPGPDFDCSAVAALIGATVGHARRLLDQLAGHNLIQQAATGRYGMHDLLRAYAVEQAAEQVSESERRVALTRLFDYYLAVAAAAADAMYPADPDRPRALGLARPPLSFAGPAAARTWLEAHRRVLVAVTAHAAGHGWPEHAIGVAAAIFRYPDPGHFADAAVVHRHACRAAAQVGDSAAEAAAMTRLGVVDAGRGRLRQAASRIERALALYREAGDRAGEAGALASLGLVGYCRGQYQQSARYCLDALALYRQAGSRAGEARVRHHLGLVDLRQGRYQGAALHLRRSLALFRQAALTSGEAYVLGDLGEVELRRGRYLRAAGYLRRSLALCRRAGVRLGEARALACLGLAELRQGRGRTATGLLRRSLALHGEVGDPSGQAGARNGLGEALLAARRAGQARIQYAGALTLAVQADDKYEQARAHNGLASAWQAAGQCGQALRHRQRALTLYTALGAPEAGQVRAELATASRAGQSPPPVRW